MLDKDKLRELHDYLRKHEWLVTYRHGICSKDYDNVSMRKCKSCGAVEYTYGVNMVGEDVWQKRHPNENYHKNRTARFS